MKPSDSTSRLRDLRGESRIPLGYCISRDRYLKRDELGVIYQLCVVPGAQRGYVGAALIREVFQRSAYGCRLYCCWCAQDLQANYFWESLGFVPIAFRAGSDKKSRVHIFWQKKIDEASATPYWYPFQTNGGAIRADRIVFPIPPGTHWTEVEAIAVPVVPVEDHGLSLLPAPEPKTKKGSGGTLSPTIDRKGAPKPRKEAIQTPSLLRGFSFAPPEPVKPVKEKARKAKPVAARIDPSFLAAARELRDRYLEQVNVHPMRGMGTYDVTRRIAGRAAALLEAA